MGFRTKKSQWHVQPVADTRRRSAAWEVARHRIPTNKRYNKRKDRYSDHNTKAAAINAAKRAAKSGESIAIKGKDGVIQRWMQA